MQGFRELIELHLAHQAEREAARKQDALRARIAQLEGAIEAARLQLEVAEGEVKRVQLERRTAELEVEKLEDTRKKYRTQLMGAKTNEVYKTLLHEIETTGHAISGRETVVLELLEVADQAAAGVTGAKGALAEAERVKAAEERNLQADIDSLEEERSEARVRAAKVAPSVPISLRDQYMRIAEARDGRGMALATEMACSACKIAIRPQAWVDMLARDEPHHCAGCKRLLYRQENLRTAVGSTVTPDASASGGRSGGDSTPGAPG